MSTSTNRALRGLLAGAAGTIAMAGMAFTIRRMVEPTKPMGKTHYEGVVEWAAGTAETENAMPDEKRIRVGEVTHIGFGAFWGAVFAVLKGKRPIRPLTEGTLYGAALWAGAFGGYMPALGISKPLQEMGNYERLRTLFSHLTFAVATLTFLKSLSESTD